MQYKAINILIFLLIRYIIIIIFLSMCLYIVLLSEIAVQNIKLKINVIQKSISTQMNLKK